MAKSKKASKEPKKKKEPKLVKLSEEKAVLVGKLKMPDIIEYCKVNNEVPWLKEIAKKEFPYTDEETGEEKTRSISFIEIRNEFLRKFFPEVAPKHTEKKKSFYDLIDEL